MSRDMEADPDDPSFNDPNPDRRKRNVIELSAVNRTFMKWIAYFRSFFSHRNQKTVIMTRPEFSDVNGDMDVRYNAEHFPEYDLHICRTLDLEDTEARSSDIFTNMHPLAIMFVKMDASNASRLSIFLNAISIL